MFIGPSQYPLQGAGSKCVNKRRNIQLIRAKRPVLATSKIENVTYIGTSGFKAEGRDRSSSEVSGHRAGGQEQLKPKTAEEAELADTLEQGSRAEARDKRSHPYQSPSQLSQGKTELCVHKTRSD